MPNGAHNNVTEDKRVAPSASRGGENRSSSELGTFDVQWDYPQIAQFDVSPRCAAVMVTLQWENTTRMSTGS